MSQRTCFSTSTNEMSVVYYVLVEVNCSSLYLKHIYMRTGWFAV